MTNETSWREPSWWAPALIRMLYQLRLATTPQLARLLDTSSSKRAWTVLTALATQGLVDSVRARNTGAGTTKAWFLTPAGADLAETAGDVIPRPYRMTPETAAGPAQTHMLEVTETGCVFVEHARGRGDECRPLDWHVEIAHRTHDGAAPRSPADLLITDAVLSYTAIGPGRRRRLLTYFLEIDRATMSVARLARKIDHYARYSTHVPAAATTQAARTRNRRDRRSGGQDQYAWRDLYPVFPKLLIVLTGAPPAALAARIADLRAWCLTSPRLQALANDMSAGAVTLTDLRDQGPFAPIVHRLLTPDPGPVDITMREET